MARFLGDASGRAPAEYTDAQVAGACSDLLTCVSGVNTKVDTACTNLCAYVNTVCTNIGTSKLSCNGSASGLSNVVNSVTAGTGIAVNQTTGGVIVCNSGGEAPSILYSCSACWDGSACIPVSSRGAYRQYQIIGHTGFWTYYCSSAAFDFAPWPGCSDMFSQFCCTQAACGWVGHHKCFNSSYNYSCAGQISWPFGCGSGCLTACAVCGFQWTVMLTPEHPCSASISKQFLYCFATTNGNYHCCTGVRNSGRAINCCGGAAHCLRGVCFSTQSGGNPFSCNAGITILGYGRMPV